jgi:hypothetical protein
MVVSNGIANRVVLISVRWPVLFINLPFHTDSLSDILSKRGCKASFGSFLVDKGMPRYLTRNSTTWQGKSEVSS